ncbi:MAG TPA: beta-N-acetylhexosaminidase [Tepidisphaeraceae bacterium]|jgi:beta-N-acetylhexosaminidase|nr:beta-N-acetylhexosaminidase [Tepidisphaeraceae bacterium]
MDVNTAIARMFVVGFDGHHITDDVRRLIDRGIGGVILFTRNVESPVRLNALCAELKGLANGRPLFIAIDQEGGRVARLRDGFTPIPSMRQLGATGDATLARRAGEVLGRELRAVNIDVNFAPVLDVDTNPANPVIGSRSFGATAALVSEMGTALIAGLQSAGVAASAKHFPGHGDTSQDSHLDLPRLPHDLERLEAVELAPFAAAVRAGVASIMSAHVLFEAIDPEYPATMSAPVLQGILRDRFGYDGVVFSDCLQMNAIAEHYGVEQAVIRGMNAGVDSFLICHHANVQIEGIEALVKAVKDGRVSQARIAQANRRIDAMCERFVRPAVPFDATQLRAEASLRLVDDIERRSVMAPDTSADPTARVP